MKIPRATYDALLADHAQLAAIRITLGIAPNRGAGSISKIDKDQELADFITKLLQSHKLAEIERLCFEKFGVDRAPSKSSIHRFWCRLNSSKSVAKRTLRIA